ncbi:unnamed protein product [Rhizophagus irregularis]|nr:unnamed protein product [Rhizophagus irregularis]
MSFRYVEVQPTFRKKLSRKITQNKESKMSDKTKESDKTKTPDKLDKFLAVSSLAEAIRTRRLDRFQDIDSTNLALYRVAFIADSVIINSLRNISEFEVEGAIRMEPQDTIFTHFPIQPQRIFGGEKGINVIVYPPAERVPEVLSKDN